MKNYSIIICLLFFHTILLSQSQFPKEPLAHTFSIVAIDKENGEMGVAVQSHWFSVGSIVAWGEAGVGVIATQSFVNVSLGPNGLDLMKNGIHAERALAKLLSEDDGRDFRQVSFLDVKGNVSAYTGQKCISEADHIIGKNYSVQANMMLNDSVVPAMSNAFEKSTGPLAERLMIALEAAQASGGDIRGQQSAAILIVKTEPTGKLWEDRLIDLRVEDHPNAVNEMRRILTVHRAYEHMNKGDLAIEHNNMELALREYSLAQEMFPENLEMKYWTAVSLANGGELEKALPIFETVFQSDKNWVTLTPRLIPNGLLTVTEEDLAKIINLVEN
ncbi:MAG: DUF1028 domain-containing protein [Melioribacteraceae bacterium]|nr:DUF1028 domain-containing protein [Melioribacteraceae bacterium]